MARVQLNVRVDPLLVSELRAQARAQGVPFGAYVEGILRGRSETVSVQEILSGHEDQLRGLDRRLARLEELAGI